MIGNFPAVLNLNRLFLKLNRFICNQLPVLPDHCLQPMTHHNSPQIALEVFALEKN